MPRAVIAPVRVVVPLREATFARGLVVAGAGAASFVVARALLGVGLPTGRGETRVDVLGATNKGSEAIHAGVTALNIPVVAVVRGKPHAAALFEAGLSCHTWRRTWAPQSALASAEASEPA